MENNLDKLFKSKLGGQEPEFNPAAWDRMEELLDDVGMIPTKKKNNRSKRIYLSLLFFGLLLSGIGYVTIKSSSALGEGSTLVDSMGSNSEATKIEQEAIPSTVKSINNQISNAPVESEEEAQKQTFNKSIKDVEEIEITSKGESFDGNEISLTKHSNEKNNSRNSDNASKRKKPISFASNILYSANNERKSIDKNQIISVEENTVNTVVLDDVSVREKPESGEIPYVNTVKEVKSDLIIEADKSKTESTIIEVLKNKETLPTVAFLNTSTDILASPVLQITPQIQMLKASLFEVGLQASVRLNGGNGYSIGPYVSYNIGKGYSINLGGQFDSQNFNDGPGISVFDKVYSFGSIINERVFVLDNQKSVRLPFGLKKSFSKFDLSTGIFFKKVFVSDGNISDSGKVNLSEKASIENEFIKSMTISFQVGGSVQITRFFDLDVGIEYRPKTFKTDQTISTNFSNYYPTIGLRYKLFKF